MRLSGGGEVRCGGRQSGRLICLCVSASENGRVGVRVAERERKSECAPEFHIKLLSTNKVYRKYE